MIFANHAPMSSHYSNKIASIVCYWQIIAVLAVMMSSDAASVASTNLKQQQQQQSAKAADEPLLRYPFAQFLANPCGLMSSPPLSSSPTSAASQSSRINQILKSVGMRVPPISKMRKNIGLPLLTPIIASSPLAASVPDDELLKEVNKFLEPFRQRYNNVNFNSITQEEKKALVDEFLLVVQELKYHSQLIQPPKDLHQCEHIQLSSLPNLKQLRLMANLKGKFDVKEIYRALALTAAHLHLMIRDHVDGVATATASASAENDPSSYSFQLPLPRQFCPSIDEPFHQKNVRVLTGKVETLMCLIFPMHRAGDAKERIDQLFDVIKSVLMQTFLHRNHASSGTADCSAREMRSCLVVRYALDVFDVAQQLGLSSSSSSQRRCHQLDINI